MKICYLALGFGAATRLGGSPRSAYYLTKSLVKRGHAVTVCCTNLASKNEKLFPQTRRLFCEGVEVVYFNTYKICPLGAHSFGLFICPDLVTFCRKELMKYDIVHMDGYRDFLILVTSYFCRRYKIPYVIQPRNSMPAAYQSILAKRTHDVLLGKRILDGCALFIASSACEAVSDFKGIVPKQKRIVQIPNGINADEYASLPKKGDFRRRNGITERILVTYLGQVHPIKGIDFLIRAFAMTRCRREGRLAIIGPDLGYKAELIAMVKQLGLTDSVTFVDPLDGEEKLQAYVDSDVVVYAAKAESFGLVAFEATMCGVPVITAQDTGCGELMDSIGAGFLTPYGDVPKLTLLIDSILESRAEVAQKVSAAAERIRRELSWDNIAHEYEDAYYSVLRQGSARRVAVQSESN